MNTISERGTFSENEKIALFTTLIYQTSYLLPSSKPQSGLLLSTAGSGKTLNLTKFRYEKGVQYTNVISPKYIIEFLKKVAIGQKRILVIPDFLMVTEGNKTTRENLIKLLRIMTEEGIDDCSHYGYPEIHFDSPVRAGLLTATTMDNVNEFKRVWKNNGFLSRLIPFSYTIGEVAKASIEDRIKNIAAKTEQEYDIILRKNAINRKPKDIILPKMLAYRLDSVAYKLASLTGSVTAPFRQQKQMHALAKAHCALRRDSEVNETDITAVLALSDNIDLSFNKI